MSEFPYMNFFIGDYLADTWTLDTIEHGAYCLLIFNYWKQGKPLENDAKTLAKMTRLSVRKWKNIAPKIVQFFEEKDGFLVHPRIEKELQKARGKSNQAAEAAKARWSGRNADAYADAEANASSPHMPERCQPEPEPISEPENIKTITPLPPQAGESEKEKINPRSAGTNPRALGTNPRAMDTREKLRQEELARVEAKITRELEDAWAEAHACSPEENLAAIQAIKQTCELARAPDDEVLI